MVARGNVYLGSLSDEERCKMRYLEFITNFKVSF